MRSPVDHRSDDSERRSFVVVDGVDGPWIRSSNGGMMTTVATDEIVLPIGLYEATFDLAALVQSESQPDLPVAFRSLLEASRYPEPEPNAASGDLSALAVPERLERFVFEIQFAYGRSLGLRFQPATPLTGLSDAPFDPRTIQPSRLTKSIAIHSGARSTLPLALPEGCDPPVPPRPF